MKEPIKPEPEEIWCRKHRKAYLKSECKDPEPLSLEEPPRCTHCGEIIAGAKHSSREGVFISKEKLIDWARRLDFDETHYNVRIWLKDDLEEIIQTLK